MTKFKFQRKSEIYGERHSKIVIARGGSDEATQSEIATPFGLAMTTSCDFECKLFHAFGNN
jgi:hypothetical protein